MTSCGGGGVKPIRKLHLQYIPLISRVRGPYGKLWTEFFPFFYGPSAKRAGHENKEGKNEDHNLPDEPSKQLFRF